MLKLIFGNFNFKTTFLLKSGLLFDEAAKLGKATRNAYNLGGRLILLALLKNRVAEGVASYSHDTTPQISSFDEYISVHGNQRNLKFRV